MNLGLFFCIGATPLFQLLLFPFDLLARDIQLHLLDFQRFVGTLELQFVFADREKGIELLEVVIESLMKLVLATNEKDRPTYWSGRGLGCDRRARFYGLLSRLGEVFWEIAEDTVIVLHKCR